MRSLAYWLCVLSVLHALNAQFDPLVRRACSKPDFDPSPKFALVAPAVLRVETNENILLEAFGLSQPVSVSVSVYDFPAKSHQFKQGSVTLNSDYNYNILQSIKKAYPDVRHSEFLSIYIKASVLTSTDKRCSRFYTPPEDKEQLSQICKGNVCRCTQVYKVRVLSVSMSQYDRYEMQILQVIKEGSEIGLKEKDTRVFLSHAGCSAGLNLLKDQDYLIIGLPSDVWQAGSDENRYMHSLGKETWVEHWPSPAECNGRAQDKCKELEKYASELGDTCFLHTPVLYDIHLCMCAC